MLRFWNLISLSVPELYTVLSCFGCGLPKFWILELGAGESLCWRRATELRLCFSSRRLDQLGTHQFSILTCSWIFRSELLDTESIILCIAVRQQWSSLILINFLTGMCRSCWQWWALSLLTERSWFVCHSTRCSELWCNLTRIWVPQQWAIWVTGWYMSTWWLFFEFNSELVYRVYVQLCFCVYLEFFYLDLMSNLIPLIQWPKLYNNVSYVSCSFHVRLTESGEETFQTHFGTVYRPPFYCFDLRPGKPFFLLILCSRMSWVLM
jgi:hypothetical protein